MPGYRRHGRGRCFDSLEKMAAALLREANVASNGLGLRIAADNRAHQVVSGPLAAVEAVVKRFELEEARVRRLNTSQAFHSAVV